MTTTTESLADQLLASGLRIGARLIELRHAGILTPAEFERLALDVLVAARDQAAGWALRDFHAAHYAALGITPTVTTAPPITATATAHRPRLAEAVRTVMTGPADEIDMRLSRLARSELADGAQTEYDRLIRDTPTVRGWTRGMESDACQLCRWWWREGRVWPADHTMPTHPGCSCTPVPVFVPADQIPRVSRAAQYASAQRRAAANRAMKGKIA